MYLNNIIIIMIIISIIIIIIIISQVCFTLTCCLNLVKYRFKNMLWEESLRRVRCEANFVSSGSKIVKRLGSRKFDLLIIERDYRSCAWPFYSLVQIFPNALHSDLQGDWDYMTLFVQTSSEETRPRSSSPLIVIRDSCSLWTWARFQTGGA